MTLVTVWLILLNNDLQLILLLMTCSSTHFPASDKISFLFLAEQYSSVYAHRMELSYNKRGHTVITVLC